jgi:hypothetical protein
LLEIEPSAPGVTLFWLGVSNEMYQVQFQTNLTATNWINVGAPIQGTGLTNVIYEAPPFSAAQGFYRLLLVP